MSIIKEIVVFSEQGNPREIKTWSNVPYFLIKTLEEQGITVHGVDLSVKETYQKVVRKIYDYVLVDICKAQVSNYSRSNFYNFCTNRKIKKAVKKFKTADALIFTTFSFSATKYSLKPSILFCDWTIEHYIKYFLNRNPSNWEISFIKRQNKVIENASCVFVLFPSIAKSMKEKFLNPNIIYNGNVTNNLIASNLDLINIKRKKKTLLFIGSEKYLKGAKDLIASFVVLKDLHESLQLHIIGIKKIDDITIPKDVFLHGYLDKGNKQEALLYYEILKSATIFINTSPKWASFSASLEAMYFYTPLIITSYTEFIETFGESIDFGAYYDSESDILTNLIQGILTDEKYMDLCINSFKAAEEHKWEDYTKRLLTKTALLLDKA